MGTATEIRITAVSAQASLYFELAKKRSKKAVAAGRSAISVPLVVRRDASSIA